MSANRPAGSGALLAPAHIHRKEWVQVIMAALLLIGGMELLTNHLDTALFEGDFIYYVDMAQNGVMDNPHLAAPFAYRPLTPLLARILADVVQQPVEVGFRLVAWGGAFLMLSGVYALARTFGALHRQGMFIMLVIALSFFHLKYLLFDVYRPDHLAYGLLIVAFLALLRGRWLLCLIISCTGLLTREFCIIPLVLLLIQQFLLLRAAPRQGLLVSDEQQYWRVERRGLLLRIGLILLLMGSFVLIPRWLLRVESTFVYATLFKDNPTPLETITLPLLSFRRNLNLIFALAAYGLPLFWLAGWAQLRRIWHELGDVRWLLGVYGVLVLGLTLIGGTDVARFVTYLHIPLVIVLARLLQQDVARGLLVGVLIALIIFNRIFEPIPPDDYNALLDFYGGYHDRVNGAIIARWQALIVLIFMGVGLRGGLVIAARDKRERLNAPSPAPTNRGESEQR